MQITTEISKWKSHLYNKQVRPNLSTAEQLLGFADKEKEALIKTAIPIPMINGQPDLNSLNKNIFLDYEITKGRGDIIKVKLNKKIIYIVDESYNSNPLSLKSAIKNFDELKIDNSKKKLILGDMLELGNYSKKLHLEAGKDINKTSLKNINVVGKHILYTYKNLDKHRRGAILKDKSKIIDLIKNDLNNNDYLMIKGSNSTGLNNLVNKLKTGKFNAL